MNRRRASEFVLCICLGLALPMFTTALPQDEFEPINIKADSSERDEKKGITSFTGSVTIEQGDTIEYLLSEERVHLIENAFVEQEGSTVRGDRIDYDIVKQLVKANSNSDKPSGRVQMVIPPRKKAANPNQDAHP